MLNFHHCIRSICAWSTHRQSPGKWCIFWHNEQKLIPGSPSEWLRCSNLETLSSSGEPATNNTRQWDIASLTCNRKKPLTALQYLRSYLPRTLAQSARKPFKVALLVASHSAIPLTETAKFTTGESDWKNNVSWLLPLLTWFQKYMITRSSVWKIL